MKKIFILFFILYLIFVYAAEISSPRVLGNFLAFFMIAALVVGLIFKVFRRKKE